jgi:hypothetical protein
MSEIAYTITVNYFEYEMADSIRITIELNELHL